MTSAEAYRKCCACGAHLGGPAEPPPGTATTHGYCPACLAATMAFGRQLPREQAHVAIRLPLRVESAANLREHKWAKMRRVRDARQWAGLLGRPLADLAALHPERKLRIMLVRLAPRPLEEDNLAYAFKAIRDGLADSLGMKDHNPRLEWMYGQRPAGPKVYEVDVLAWALPKGTP